MNSCQALAQTHVRESVKPSNHLILCWPRLLLPSIFPIISVFSNVSFPHQVEKVLDLQFHHQPFQWIFRVDFLTLQPPLSMEIPRQQSWSGLPFPPPGALRDSGIETMPPVWQVDSLPMSHQRDT